jgi:ribonuclease-3
MSLLNFDFLNIDILNQALTHSSFKNERKLPDFDDNERLEFLGDSILGLIISEMLYIKYPERDVGFISKLKSMIVSQKFLALISRKLELSNFILLGNGEIKQNARHRTSLLADTLESILGAMYLDRGYNKVKQFVYQHFEEEMDKALKTKSFLNSKGLLQEYSLTKYNKVPKYTLLERGKDKKFLISVKINNKVIAKGVGRNKKEAEQESAFKALKKFNLI